LPYAAAPLALDGKGLIADELNWNKPAWVGPTYLISGAATRHEMMRGEETEAIGLMADAGLSSLGQRSLLILPGTHSKHIWIEDQRIVNFRTFMTGELFDVLGWRCSACRSRARGISGRGTVGKGTRFGGRAFSCSHTRGAGPIAAHEQHVVFQRPVDWSGTRNHLRKWR